MYKKLFILATFCLSFCAFCEEEKESQEIRVQLATDNILSPLYLGKISSSTSSLDRQYVQQLEAILQFDLNYNGQTKVVPRNEQKEIVLLDSDCQKAFDPILWKKHGVAFVVKGTITGKTLSVYAFSAQTGSLKHFKDIALSGSLAQDRRQIHKAADAVHRSFFATAPISNTRILYSVQAKNAQNEGSDWTSEIWECDWDGGNARQVTKENSYCVSPVILPSSPQTSSDRFLYVSYKLGQPKIYLATLKEGIGKRLIDLKGNQLLPAVSPQRDKMAFICDAAGRTDLFIQPFHPERGEIGKPIQLFSYPRSTQASPTFSPNGSKVAFVSDKDGAPRIYVIPSEVGEKRANAELITKQNKESSCPAWSPDGTKLAYSAKTNAIRQIWIYDFASGEERQLTAGPGNKENPCWAPDSIHIVFNSTDPSSSELYLVNLNQPEAVKISQGPGKKHYPTWGTR